MSKATLAIIAASSAAAGAAITAAIYSSRKTQPIASSTTVTSTTTVRSNSTSPASPIPAPIPVRPDPVTPSLTGSITDAPVVDPNGLFQYGFPGPIADLRPTPSLTSSYDRRTRNPAWVAEHITPASLAIKAGDRKHSVFHEDESIPPAFRAKLKDYYRSGFDRGHQVPAADAKWSQQAMDATFALSNMCPQVGDGFNRDYWAHFEDFCRRITGRYPSVRIVTGPLYLPKRGVDGKWKVEYEVIGSPPSVAVPTHFFKVIFAEDGRVGGNVALGAFVLPNAPIANDKKLSDFEVPLAVVERASGLEFAGRLPEVRRKKLCEEIKCDIIVRDYKSRQKAFQKNGQ